MLIFSEICDFRQYNKKNKISCYVSICRLNLQKCTTITLISNNEHAYAFWHLYIS